MAPSVAAAALVLAPASAFAQRPAPVTGTGQPGAISERYIVVMKSAASGVAEERTKQKMRARGGRLDRDYGAALKGYAAVLPAEALAEVRSDPDVAYIEADAVASATAAQLSAPWGLDRIDQSSLPLSGSYSYDRTGTGVTAYIVDTGIRLSHLQFGDRAVSGYDAIDGGSADDCDGHGTHVAGVVGGSTYGVAKQVRLVAVRVLDCAGNGTTSSVLAGIDWITSNHPAGQPAVANMSLGSSASSAVDAAVQNSIDDGVSYAASAGNDNTDACMQSPARAANALTVASTTLTDARSSFSNFGTCVDLFAPGSSTISSWHTSDTATNTISGTSMATPHVAGVAALYLQDNPAAAPATVANAVIASATIGKVNGAGAGSPNRLLQTVTPATIGTSAPDTSIDSGVTASASPSFAFSSSEDASTFACKLDGPDSTVGAFGPCSSPQSYSSLADGSYTFSVRATDRSGNTDATPATRTFTVQSAQPAPPSAFVAPPSAVPSRSLVPPVAWLDRMAPMATLSGSRLQKVGRHVRIRVSCVTEPCGTQVSGAVRVPRIVDGSSRLFKLKRITAVIAQGATVTLRPMLSYSAGRAIRSMLGRGRPISTKLTITVVDRAGNSRTLTRHVKFKR